MRRLSRWMLLVLAVFLLASCAPTTQPSLYRSGDDLVVTVEAFEPFYAVTLSLVNATTDDPRCAQLEGDVSCVIGDLVRGEHARVEATATSPDVSCVAFGYHEFNDLTTYRPYTCRVHSE